MNSVPEGTEFEHKGVTGMIKVGRIQEKATRDRLCAKYWARCLKTKCNTRRKTFNLFSYEDIINGIKPEEVKVVEKLAKENAAQNDRDNELEVMESRVYTYPDKSSVFGDVAEHYWVICDSIEICGVLGYYKMKDNLWYYPGRLGPRPMPGGFAEAQTNASIMFTWRKP